MEKITMDLIRAFENILNAKTSLLNISKDLDAVQTVLHEYKQAKKFDDEAYLELIGKIYYSKYKEELLKLANRFYPQYSWEFYKDEGLYVGNTINFISKKLNGKYIYFSINLDAYSLAEAIQYDEPDIEDFDNSLQWIKAYLEWYKYELE